MIFTVLSLISQGTCQGPLVLPCDEPEASPPTETPERPGPQLQADLNVQGGEPIVVYTRVCVLAASLSPKAQELKVVEKSMNDPAELQLYALPYPQVSPSPPLLSLHRVGNTIQLSSQWRLNRETLFLIYHGDQIVGRQEENLKPVSRPDPSDNAWLYMCDIAGASWKALCEYEGTHTDSSQFV